MSAGVATTDDVDLPSLLTLLLALTSTIDLSPVLCHAAHALPHPRRSVHHSRFFYVSELLRETLGPSAGGTGVDPNGLG